jgi:hypothetical protein
MPDATEYLPVRGAAFRTAPCFSSRNREYRAEGARYVPLKEQRKPRGDRPVYNMGMNGAIQSQAGRTLCTTWGQQRLGVEKYLVRPCGQAVENFVLRVAACRPGWLVRRVAQGRPGRARLALWMNATEGRDPTR